MSKKRIQQIPQEAQKGEDVELTNEFLYKISHLLPGLLHCFDKSSIIKTTRKGNLVIPLSANQRWKSSVMHQLQISQLICSTPLLGSATSM